MFPNTFFIHFQTFCSIHCIRNWHTHKNTIRKIYTTQVIKGWYIEPHTYITPKAAATLGGIACGNDRGIASVVWQVTLKYMGALIGRQCRCHCRRHDSGNDRGKK